MSNSNGNWIVLFDSIHYVLAAERVLKARRLWHDVVPAPRQLSTDCGMSIEIHAADAAAVREILSESPAHWRRIYRPGPDGWLLEDETPR